MAEGLFNYAHDKLPWVSSLLKPNDDSHSDRLNHRYTVGFLISCVFVIVSSVFVFNRISCWVPAQFVGAYQTYTNNYCWVANTYYIPSNVSLPHSELDRERAAIGYYQWTPLILMFVAMCFYLPRMLWRSMNTRSGLDLQHLVTQSNAARGNDAKKKINEIVRAIDYYCQPNKFDDNHGNRCVRILSCTGGKRLGNYLRSIQLMVKFLYLINSIIQLVVIHTFLGQPGWFYGINIWHNVFIVNSVLTDSPYFPRVTLCDLRIREVGNLHRYSVQCVLPINMLNEKIFALAWFWFVIVFIYNLWAFISVLLDTLFAKRRINFIRHLYQTSGAPPHIINEEILREFTQDFLMQDGVLVIRLIAENERNIVATHVVRELMTIYQERQTRERREVEQQEFERRERERQLLQPHFDSTFV